jgi:hypothetical protein
VLVVEAARHAAAQLQPVLLELPHAGLLNAWPGGLPCRWNRGPVDTVACRESPRGKPKSQRSRPWIKLAEHGSAREPGWLVGRLRLGSAMPAPPGQITSTLGAVGERGSQPRGPLAGPTQATTATG